MTVTGLLLAAGAGTRLGKPKSLLVHPSGQSFIGSAVNALREGGCADVTVVLGAAREAAASMVAGADVVIAESWEVGMGESLKAGLLALGPSDASAALVLLVDLPDVGTAVIQRVLGTAPVGPGSLARASFDGVPGHPVLLGRDHWEAVSGSAYGDRGARDYLGSHDVLLVECGDLASGRDIDTPEDERRYRGPNEPS
ncbi:MAG: nucleotidyltransferase family protein [Marmoricola sp.]|nr:nucleotidyltransferase family protein [Marmoricola sp.]